MPYEEEMEEKSESEYESEGDEKKVESEEDMLECLMKDVDSVEDAKDALEKYGYELVKKDADEEEKSSKYEDVEKELGMGSKPPTLSVIRISSARKALNKARKGK